MSREGVRKRGKGWVFIIDLGRQPARQCRDCRRRTWIELNDDGHDSCPRCDGQLGEVREERRQKWSRQHETETEAARGRRKALGDIDAGRDPFPDSMTVREFAGRWVKHKSGIVRPNTLTRYRSLLRLYVLPVIGSQALRSVRVAHVQRVLDLAGDKGLSARSVHHVRSVMSGLFSTAASSELIYSNPVKAMEGSSVPRPDLAVPSAEEAMSLLREAKGTVWAVPLLIAIASGARRSEVLGLGWSAVDLDRGKISIVRNLQRVPGEGLRFFEPKTQRSRRMIALPPFVIPVLKAHRAEQASRRLTLGAGWEDHDLVFERGDGGPLDPDSFTHATKRLIRKAGLDPATRLHDLRHSLATTLLEEGIDAAVVSAVLGHSSPGFTAATYQHVTEGLTEQAAAAVERRFGAEFADRFANRSVPNG